MLISYHSLLADKVRGLTDMIKICCELFGSVDNLAKYKDSILLGVTQVPKKCEDEDLEPLDHLKEFIADREWKDPLQKSALAVLSRRVFIYDPLDSPNLQYSGAWTREEILSRIGSLKAMENPSQIFRTILTPQDESGLIKLTHEIQSENTRNIRNLKSLFRTL